MWLVVSGMDELVSFIVTDQSISLFHVDRAAQGGEHAAQMKGASIDDVYR